VADRLFEPEVSRSLQWLSDWYKKPVALAIECKRCTGKSYVLVNFRFTKKAPRKDLPKGLNKCFALTPTQYLEAVKYCEGVGRKSIPIEWFQENVLELKRVKYESGYGWDLSPLVKEVDLTNVN
jgi:hypothetical protein